jgi:hypothetical protein
LTQCGEEDIEFKIQNSKVKSKKTLKEAIVTKVGGFKRKERNERKDRDGAIVFALLCASFALLAVTF